MKRINILIVALLFLGTGLCNAQYNVLLNFDSANGEHPYGSLTFYANKLYGMTEYGGANNAGCIFRIDTDGTGYQDLYDFNDTTGGYPAGDLTISGNKMYGMSAIGIYGFGNIFSIDTDGNGYKNLFNFNDTDGAQPMADLTLSGGKLYGMTPGWNISNGNIFSIDTDGNGFRDLFDFNFTDGAEPYGSLALSGSIMYGMAGTGGPYRLDGDIFSIDTNGNGFTVMHYFNDTAGAGPPGSLILSGSKLYGMTHRAETSGGCIFSINTNGGGYSVMHYFDSIDYGGWTWGSLTLSGSTLYGLGNGGGEPFYGCIFRIDTNGNGYKDMFYFNGYNGGGPEDGVETHWGSLIQHGYNLYGMALNGGTSNDGVVFSIDTDAIASVNNLKGNAGRIGVYPNPSIGQFTFQLSVVSGQFSVEIYNVLGERIATPCIVPLQTTIDLQNQSAGVYFYRVLSEGTPLGKEDGEIVGDGKLVIEK